MRVNRLICALALIAIVSVIMVAMVPSPDATADAGGGAGSWKTYDPQNPVACWGPPWDCYLIVVNPPPFVFY